MKTITLNSAEIVVLRKMLDSYSDELSTLAGQDLSVELVEMDNDLLKLAADTMNTQHFDVVDTETDTFNLYTASLYFINKLEA